MWFLQTAGHVQINKVQSSLPLQLCRIKLPVRNVNGPCEKRRFALLGSALPLCDEARAHWVKPQTWLLCSESEGAASLQLLPEFGQCGHCILQLTGWVLFGGRGICLSGRFSAAVWQSCSFRLAQMYTLNVFWCVFPPPPL